MNDIVAQPFDRTVASGQSYTFHPITVDDWAAFCTWINTSQGMNANRIVQYDEMMGAVESVQGMVWLCWRAAKATHPNLNLQSFRKEVNLPDLMEIIKVITDVPTADEGDAGSDPQGSQSTGSSSS